ncbi:MAG: hypothetical protein ABI619_14350, partial [Betaproteobacteria bacterium]
PTSNAIKKINFYRLSGRLYQKLQTQLEQLHRRHPEAHIHLRIDAAGQYAANLEAFVRSLDHLPMTVSVGEPKRNKDYHRAHSPKRKHDASESLAMARYAVVERPQPSHGKPPAFAVLRRTNASCVGARFAAARSDETNDSAHQSTARGRCRPAFPNWPRSLAKSRAVGCLSC